MITCAIVGATGLVGSTFLKVLEEKNLKIDKYVLLASKRSKGKVVKFLGKDYVIEELDEHSFDNNRFDYALFSAGGDTSKKYSPIAAKNGCIVIDNSSAFRMKSDVPLVVPEVNVDKAFENNGIIANPNCSTIQAVVILNALREYGIKRVIYSTYQAVSGAGYKGLLDLEENTSKKFPYKIVDNCLPHIDVFLENGYTKEEVKMIEETKKILDDDSIKITATCARVPVRNSHSESINIEFKEDFDILEVKQKLNLCDGIVVLDDIARNIYPINTFADGKDEVFVGRIRRDFSVKSGLNIWCVADNIRKGAASNAVQILEKLIERRLGN